jgi:hypothetical protein
MMGKEKTPHQSPRAPKRDPAEPSFGADYPKTKFWVGNQYANRFRSALDVAAYVQANAERLTRLTNLLPGAESKSHVGI